MFSIKESVKYGWQKMKENFQLVFFSTLIILAVSALANSHNESRMEFETSLLVFLAFIFMIIIQIGYEKILLKIYDGDKPKLPEMFQHYGKFWKYIGTSILNCLAVLGGFILLIIPGIYWAVRFSFSPLVVVDTGVGPVAAMKESWAITKGSFWKLFLFWLTVVLINLAGIVAIYIGLLITVPVTTLAMVFVYRELTRKKAALSAQPSATPSTS